MTAKTPAELQKNYRDRKRQTLIDNNARVIKYVVYPGTDRVIKKICARGGYAEEQEALTILLKNVDELSMDELDKLLKI